MVWAHHASLIPTLRCSGQTSISVSAPASLEVWQAEGKRGAWVQIPLSQAELVPVVAKVCCFDSSHSPYLTPFVLCLSFSHKVRLWIPPHPTWLHYDGKMAAHWGTQYSPCLCYTLHWYGHTVIYCDILVVHCGIGWTILYLFPISRCGWFCCEWQEWGAACAGEMAPQPPTVSLEATRRTHGTRSDIAWSLRPGKLDLSAPETCWLPQQWHTHF